MDQNGYENRAFEFDTRKQNGQEKKYVYTEALQENQRVPPPLVHPPEEVVVIEKEQIKIRHTWNNGLEFLMSCIAMSVGLGNIWRFPYAVYKNGGGAFLIPYFIVLFVIGKPFYFLEMIMGQFSSTSCIKVWNRIPALRGIGCAQAYSMFCLSTYYCAIMGITVIYVFSSFSNPLPWAECSDEWRPNCLDSSNKLDPNANLSSYNSSDLKSSAELYFMNKVLKQGPSLEDGLGVPDWKLVLAIAAAWLCIGGILIGGVKSSGKAAYFLALFPYVIMLCLLIRACTLKGAAKGIIFFIKPNWSKLLEVDVWFAAITQCFFSLSIVFGALIMYSSYNNFSHNIHRDVTVVTILDTFTSLIAGFTIFGILGNQATELNVDIDKIVKSDAALAFISYPDAIAKFDYVPQLFSVAFFAMLFILGIGSGVGIIGGVVTVINDQFPKWKHSYIVIGYSIVGFLIGLVYCTSNGQAILGLVDHYACSFIVFSIAAFEIGGIFWIYGLENFLDDVEYMLKKRPSIYWRICWAIITPISIIAIFIYSVIKLEPLTYNGALYPEKIYYVGNVLMLFGVLQIPIWAIYTIFTYRKKGLWKALCEAFLPREDYGPHDKTEHRLWGEFKEEKRQMKERRRCSRVKQFVYVLLGLENKLHDRNDDH